MSSYVFGGFLIGSLRFTDDFLDYNHINYNGTTAWQNNSFFSSQNTTNTNIDKYRLESHNNSGSVNTSGRPRFSMRQDGSQSVSCALDSNVAMNNHSINNHYTDTSGIGGECFGWSGSGSGQVKINLEQPKSIIGARVFCHNRTSSGITLLDSITLAYSNDDNGYTYGGNLTIQSCSGNCWDWENITFNTAIIAQYWKFIFNGTTMPTQPDSVCGEIELFGNPFSNSTINSSILNTTVNVSSVKIEVETYNVTSKSNISIKTCSASESVCYDVNNNVSTTLPNSMLGIRYYISLNTTNVNESFYVQNVNVSWTEFTPNETTSITLIIPLNNSLNLSKTINFVFNSSTSANDILSCELWNNETSWATKQGNTTRITVNTTSTIQYIFSADGDYKWNILCNNTKGNLDFASNNYTVRIHTYPPTYNNFTFFNNGSTSTKRLGMVNWSIVLNDSRNLSYAVLAVNDSGVFINQSFKSIGNNVFINFSDINYSIRSNRNYKVCGIIWWNNSINLANATTVNDTGACFIVNNSKSIVKNMNITPNPPLATSNLSCNYTDIDDDLIDENNLTITYDWFKNGSSQSINYSVLFSGNLTNGELWQCAITAWDGVENSTKNLSSNVTIGDNINPNISFTFQNVTTFVSGGSIQFLVNVSDASSSIDFVRTEIEDSNSVKTNFSMTLIQGTNGAGNSLQYERNYTASSPTGTYYVKFWVQDTSGNLGNSSNRNLSFTVTQSQQQQQGSGGGGGGGGGTLVIQKGVCNIKLSRNNITLSPDKQAIDIMIMNGEEKSVTPNFIFKPTNTSENILDFVIVTKDFTDILPKQSETFNIILINSTFLQKDIKTDVELEFTDCNSLFLTVTLTPQEQGLDLFENLEDIGISKNTLIIGAVIFFLLSSFLIYVAISNK